MTKPTRQVFCCGHLAEIMAELLQVMAGAMILIRDEKVSLGAARCRNEEELRAGTKSREKEKFPLRDFSRRGNGSTD
jgi:hypothetical protein